MMAQSRHGSAAEAVANVAVGYVVALLTQMVVFPVMEMQVSFGKNLLIGLAFTVVSLCRSYVLRRLFNRMED